MLKQIELWDRKFNLDVTFKDLDDEGVLDKQHESIDKFILSKEQMRVSLEAIKSYIIKDENSDVEVNDIKNIFKYVIPESIYIRREMVEREVIIMCDYKFNIEHGIAIVFENEKFKAITDQDSVL